MHILIVHQAFASLQDAGGTRHHEMAQYLISQGDQVTIIASPISYLTGKSRSQRQTWVEKEEPQPGLTILRTYTYPALHRSFFHRLISFFSFMFSSFWVGMGVQAVDVVWGTSPPIFQGWTAWLLARLKGVKFLFEIRDLWPAFAIAVGVLKNPILIRASEMLERFLYRHADRVIVNSPGFLDHVTSRGAKQVELIPNGADPDMFDPQADGLYFRKSIGLGNEFIAIYAGAHGMSNDLNVILDAAVRLHDHREIQIVLVGDGKEKASLQEKAGRMGLDNVHFISSAPKTEMKGILAAADACIAILKPIELYKTTYPNKVFDYMAAGKPVLLAIDGVIREVIESTQSGLFIQPGDGQAMADGILKLASNRQAAQEMGMAGRRAVEDRFNRTHSAEQLKQVLHEMR